MNGKKENENLEEEVVIEGEAFDVDDVTPEETPKVESSGGDEELIYQFARLQADFTNYKKRVEKEKTELISLGVKKIALDILPVLDNFERALESFSEHESHKEMYDGVDMIYKQLVETLGKHSIEEMVALDEKFDPNYHHAVLMEEKEGYDPDIVINVLQKGYVRGEEVIRPAMVVVSK